MLGKKAMVLHTDAEELIVINNALIQCKNAEK